MKPAYKVYPKHPPMDWRLLAERNTNSRLKAKYFSSAEEVDRRREELQFNMRMAFGLYPWPEKTPLNTKLEHVGDYEGYCIKKIMFESMPGFWSTGNLYLPTPLKEKNPAILYFIGHFDDQRLTREERIDVPQQLANFARMGFICLATDMIGKVDSLQISHEYGRDEKELWNSNGAGIQLWNNIRALDYLCDMPEVDAERIGVTGCSGGATQSLNLSLVDDRIAAIAPINMISLEMQGGCQCENAPGLRRDTENCEMCSMLAPRPLFLAGSTGDWTRNQETIEYPAIKAVYDLYGAGDKVEHFYQVANHQYNGKTRRCVYNFFARTLMDKDIHWEEQPIESEDLQAFTWFHGKGHAPGIANDTEFFEAHKAELSKRTATLSKDDKKKMLAWLGGMNDKELYTADGNHFTLDGMALEHNVAFTHGGVQLPYVKLTPANWDQKRVCLVLSDQGKDVVERENFRQMLREGIAVICGDLFLLGENAEGKIKIMGDPQGTRYYTTFHYSTDAYRIQDTVLLWKIARSVGEDCTLWAEGAAARAAACALPFLDNVQKAILENSALQLDGDMEYYEKFNVPGIMLVGGIEGCLSLADCPVERF